MTKTMSLSEKMLRKIQLADERLGLKIYAANQKSKVSKIVMDILSFTGDEMVWFGVSTGAGSLLFFYRFLWSFRDMGCVEEVLWDMFGSCAVCIFFESVLKLIFQRIRPDYAEQAKEYCCHGEWFSFPSGHALRTFYWPFWLSRSKFVKLIAPVIKFPRARYFIPWALAVGYSRVAKGRHYPLDVAFGSLVGVVVGYVVEDVLDDFFRAVFKTIAGCYIALNFGYYVVIPLANRNTAESNNLKSTLVTACLYGGYGIILFFSTLPVSYDSAGNQTIEPGVAEGTHQCKMFW